MSGCRSRKIVAFVATSAPAKAKKFYRDKLGLRLVDEGPFALVFDAHGTMLRVTPVDKVAAAGYTVLGWQVPDIEDAVKRLEESWRPVPALRGNGSGQAGDLAVAGRRANRLVQGSGRQHAERLAALRTAATVALSPGDVTCASSFGFRSLRRLQEPP